MAEKTVSASDMKARCRILRKALITAAGKMSASVYEYGQNDHPKDDTYTNSYCQGLSALFLVWCRDGKTTRAIIDKLNLAINWNGTTRTTVDTPECAFVMDATNWGNTPFEYEPVPFHKTFGDTYHMTLNGIKPTSMLYAHSSAGEYCAKQYGYSIVRVYGHVLAVAVHPGLCLFFDPNCGIVEISTTDLTDAANKMKILFTEYFDHPDVKHEYGNTIEVERYV